MGWTKSYAEPIGEAALWFLLLCLALAIPYFAWQYRRRGTITPARAWAQSTLLLYLMCAWALVLLPFPEDACARDVSPQTEFLNWWRLAQENSGAPLLTNPNVVMFVFNIALLLPLGVYLRRWFGKGFLITTAIGFTMSLAFEVTQLTGIYGLYDCPYRQFNVDDLFANTTGAALGWLVAPLVFFIPRPGAAPERRDTVTVPRRALSMIIDFVVALALAVFVSIAARYFEQTIPNNSLVVSLALTTWLIPLITGGRTPGQFAVGIRMESTSGGHRNPARLAARWVLVWGFYPLMLVLILYGAPRSDTPQGIVALALAAGLTLWPLALVLRVHERLSGTRTVPDQTPLSDDSPAPAEPLDQVGGFSAR